MTYQGVAISFFITHCATSLQPSLSLPKTVYMYMIQFIFLFETELIRQKLNHTTIDFSRPSQSIIYLVKCPEF